MPGNINLNKLVITETTCNWLNNPLVISTDSPCFGCRLCLQINNAEQTAYQLEIYSDVSGRTEKIGIQKQFTVTRSQSVKPNIDKQLVAGAKYQWRVRILG